MTETTADDREKARAIFSAHECRFMNSEEKYEMTESLAATFATERARARAEAFEVAAKLVEKIGECSPAAVASGIRYLGKP